MFTIYSLSEYAVTLTFGDQPSEEVLRQITSFKALLHAHPFAGFRIAVPAYTTLTVFFDPVTVIRDPNLSGISCFERVSRYIHELGTVGELAVVSPPAVITIPVCYGNQFGPDLELVSRYTGLTPEEVIQLHSSTTYRVHLIGFTPGFAYLGGLLSRLKTPRRSSPRQVVNAGSVGIAGYQTGIYPMESPGGWQLIGRTPVRLFDVRRPTPALLRAGDLVIFRAISVEEFAAYEASNAGTSD